MARFNSLNVGLPAVQPAQPVEPDATDELQARLNELRNHKKKKIYHRKNYKIV